MNTKGALSTGNALSPITGSQAARTVTARVHTCSRTLKMCQTPVTHQSDTKFRQMSVPWPEDGRLSSQRRQPSARIGITSLLRVYSGRQTVTCHAAFKGDFDMQAACCTTPFHLDDRHIDSKVYVNGKVSIKLQQGEELWCRPQHLYIPGQQNGCQGWQRR